MDFNLLTKILAALGLACYERDPGRRLGRLGRSWEGGDAAGVVGSLGCGEEAAAAAGEGKEEGGGGGLYAGAEAGRGG